MRPGEYRYPNEHIILALTSLLVLGVIIITVASTFCLSGVFVLAFLAISYYMSQAHHQSLIQNARAVKPDTMPKLYHIAQVGTQRLRPGPLKLYVAPSNTLNAYTFGLTSPKVVVLYSSLLGLMDEDEIAFILGHEMGHVALGHTWLNSLVGGIAGIPSPWAASILLILAFRGWNRACEFSADRAGLLVCGDINKAISALVKLAAGPEADTHEELLQAYRQLDAEDDTFLSNLGESLGTHPMTIKRINEMRRFAASEKYRRLRDML
jgi:Zn-dependent protease with chaperone function